MSKLVRGMFFGAVASLVVPAMARGEAILVLHMDDVASPIADATGTYSGTYTGSAFLENGPLQYALGFDGNDRVAVTPDSALNFDSRSFTIEMWVNQDSATRAEQEVVASKPDGPDSPPYNQNMHLRIYSSGQIRFDWYGSATDAYGVFTPDEWHHLAFTYDYNAGTNDGTRRIFLDGAIVGEQTGRAPYLGNSSNAFYIGSWGGSQYFHGLMDEVRVYDSALDEATVLGHFNLEYADYTPIVPEPSTWAMLLGLAGAGLVGCLRRRRRS